MPKVILICGRLCSGKTTYAREICRKSKAVMLSVDELMLSLLDPYLGDRHEYYTEKAQKYLFDRSLDILEAGADVVLDWGFWTNASREYAREFYKSRGIPCEMHYIVIDEAEWKARIAKRNESVAAGEISAYFVDENLAEKFEGMFELPRYDEIEVIVNGG